jgi:hypothetical protein
MYRHYFDCYSIADQLRFNNTLEKLQQYVGEKCKNFGSEISTGLADPSKRFSCIEMAKMPQKQDATTGQMVDMTTDLRTTYQDVPPVGV